MRKEDVFKYVELEEIERNVFDLSHDVKLSLRMGELVPTCVFECVPGDKFRISVENMLRLAPLVSPVMHKINVTTHFFFVPNRILWPQWEKWITGEIEVQHPILNSEAMNLLEAGSIGDYMGLPVGVENDRIAFINAFPFSAYYKIYDEYYRDQNLIEEKWSPLQDGINYIDIQSRPLRRAWMHDYFTSCLPFAQKGDAVTFPLTAEDRLYIMYDTSEGTGNRFLNPDGSTYGGSGDVEFNTQMVVKNLLTNTNDPVVINMSQYYVDPNAEAVDINTVRRAFRLQEWLERNARGGTRYIENILAHFGVKSSDARLQRPEYIGGLKQTMVISEVLSTAQNLDESGNNNYVIGQLAGHGISVSGSEEHQFFVEEHGWIIGIMNVQPVTAYFQGIHRSICGRLDKLDYYWPTFAHIGEQEVYLKELYMYGDPDTYEETFGYIPRYSEYRYVNNRVAGEMKTNLLFWHLARKFDTKPSLNEQFIECNPSTRIFTVLDDSVDNVYAHVYNNIIASRKMPVFGIPTI